MREKLFVFHSSLTRSSLITCFLSFFGFFVQAFFFELFPLVFDVAFEIARQSLYGHAVLSAELTPEQEARVILSCLI